MEGPAAVAALHVATATGTAERSSRWSRVGCTVARWRLEVCDCARRGREDNRRWQAAGGVLCGEGTAAAGWPPGKVVRPFLPPLFTFSISEH
ncbi:aspartate/glutamate racemase family protein [Sesbania bispinosa]|nr:aspartate/glutamate racemase family protein [Sesbania bispinosa]